MKKVFYFFAAAALTLGLASCNNGNDDNFDTNKLDAPELVEQNVTSTTATIGWTAVENATEYVYSLNGGVEMSTTNTSFTLTDLEPNTEYTVKVQARRPNSEFFADSEWATLKFKTAEPGQEGGETAHLATFGDDWDTWHYEWDGDNVKRIYRLTEDGGLDREWVFAYNGNTINVTGKNEYKMTLNDKGLVQTFDKEGDIYEYVYDDEGYMISAKKNGELCSEITIENGNLILWTRNNGEWQFKDQTFDAKLNVAGIHTVYAESAGASRWLVETGLFGKGSRNLCLTSKWQHSDTSAEYTYEFDAEGRVVQEIKNYGGDIENFFFTY